MLNELITWVLNTYLGKYLEDFNPAQLSVALLSGEVELENVPIRRDALRSFGIPIQVLSGSIGKIKLQIPLRQFRTAAWCIVIEHVYGVIGPKDLNDWDYEKEKNSEYEFKLEILNAKEAEWRAENRHILENYYSTSYSSWLKYGTSLGTSILENLELKINDVHLRFEDSTSNANAKFAGGIKIASLTAQSCDSSWNANSKGNRDVNATYKIIELSDFSLYWDRTTEANMCSNLSSKDILLEMNSICNIEAHQFIINPISAKAKCKREKCREALRSRLRPRLSCDLLIPEVKVSVSDAQYLEMLNCVGNLQQLSKVLIYRTKRPPTVIRGNAKLWWKYAAECNGFTFSDTHDKWQVLRENLRYIRICKNLMLNPNFNTSSEDKEFKTCIEKTRNLDELTIIRNACFKNVFAKELNLKNRTVNEGKSMLFHWFPSWRGWYGTGADTATAVATVQNDAYKEIEDDILNELENSLDIENDSFSKRDAVLCCFTLILVKGQFIMNVVNYNYSYTHKSKESEKIESEESRETRRNVSSKTIFVMEFQQLIGLCELKPRFDSYLIGLSLGSVCLKDMLTEGTVFPNIIKPQALHKSPTKDEPTIANFKRNFIKSKEVDDSEPWFQLQYEKRPTQVQSDYALAVRSKGLDIFYNRNAFDRLICFWLIPLQKQEWFAEEKQKKSSLKFLQNWRDALMSQKVHQRSWSLEIDIFAPRIIFVENLLDENTTIILADFGRFKLIKNDETSNAADNTDNACHSKNGNKLSKIDSEEDELFMTPCSTPPGSEISLSDESPTMCHDNSNLPNFVINKETDLESAFYKKIYDKYFISLSDLQVLICKNRDRDLPSFKSSSNFHLLDKFDISLDVERRNIFTSDLEYPLVTLHGTLSRISAHVNEQRIGEFLKILLPIISHGYTVNTVSSGKPEDTTDATVVNSGEDATTTTTTTIHPGAATNMDDTTDSDEKDEKSATGSACDTNMIILDFVIGQMILEIQSCDKSLAELQVIGARASITKKLKETYIRMSVHGLLLVDAIQSFGPDFELLVASHRHVGMDSMSGSLKHSEPCSPIAPESPDPLASQRPTSPHIISKAVDFLTAGNEDKNADFDEMHALITIDIYLTEPSEDSENQFQLANISFNNLNVIANQETITELMGFMKRTYDTYKFYQMENVNITPPTSNGVDGIDNKTRKKEGEEPATTKANNSSSTALHKLKTKLNFDFHRLNILVVSTVRKESYTCARKVSTLIMSEAKIHATFGKDIYTTGSLGGIQIIDITPEGINHQRILSVGKDPLTEPPNISNRDSLLCTLTNEMYANNSNEPQYDELNALVFKVYGGKNSHVNLKVRMASVWYTHCPRFVHEINICISQFKTYLKNFAKSLRSKAAHMAIGLVQQISEATTENKGFLNKNTPKISMDIVLNSPVLVLPRSSQSCDVFVANLGKITAYNTHEISESTISHNLKNTEDTVDAVDAMTKECYFLDIRNINLYSLNTSKRKDIRLAALPKADEFYSCKNDALAILYDTAMQFKFTKLNQKIKSNSKWLHKNIFLIQGSVTQVLQVSLSRLQYEQLNESLENAMKMDFGPVSTDARHHHHPNYDYSYDSGDYGYDYQQHSNSALSDEIDRNELHMPLQTYETKMTFSVPIFKIHLKNEHNNSIIRITFREFSIENDDCDGTKNLQIMLRSILVEDLKCAKTSRLRNMVDCSSDNLREKLIKNNHCSASCPNLANYCMKDNRLSISMPTRLDAIAQSTRSMISRRTAFTTDNTTKFLRYSGRQATTARTSTLSVPKGSINNNNNSNTNNINNDNEPNREIDENLVIYRSKTITTGSQGSKTSGEKSFRGTNSSIDFNCLNLTISLDKWFIIFDFFGLISEGDVKHNVSPKSETTADESIHKKELKISVRSLNLILVRNEMELSKANISNAYFEVNNEHSYMKHLNGYLGSLSLYDLTPFGAMYCEKFSTTGTEALRFSYERLRTETKAKQMRSLDMDALLKIEMSSVRYIHTKRFIMELHLFINELLQLQTPVINRIKVPESWEKNITSNPFKIGLDIHAGSPIILLPLYYHSNQMLVADLGEFTLKNKFLYASDTDVISAKRDENLLNEILDVMHVDLVNTNIFAGERIVKTDKLIHHQQQQQQQQQQQHYGDNNNGKSGSSSSPISNNTGKDKCSDGLYFNNFYVAKVGSNLIKETCYLKLQVERNTDSSVSHNCADISVKGTFSKLNGTINLQQYKLIRGFLSHNLGEDIEDVYYNYSNHLCESIERLNSLNPVVQKHKNFMVWKTLSIKILLENVSIVIMEPSSAYGNILHNVFYSNRRPQLLACINFITSSLEIDSFSDGSQDIDLISSEILIVDSRENDNVFKHILQPKKGGDSNNVVQAEIHCRKKPNSSKYTVLLNNMRVMAILDCLESLKNFFKEEPYIASAVIPVWQTRSSRRPTSTHPLNRSQMSQQQDDEDSFVWEIVLNITDSELVLAENFTQRDANAVILKNTTVFSYKPKNASNPVSIDINHLEIFSCMLGLEDASALSIIDPFCLNLEIKDDCVHIFVHKQLNIRLSYNDIKLFKKMLHLLPKPETINDEPTLTTAETALNCEMIQPLLTMGFSQKDSWNAMQMNDFKLNDAALWLEQHKSNNYENPFFKLNKVMLNANCVSICIIDDCMDSDVPLLELSLNDLKVEQNLRSDIDKTNFSYFEGQLETIFGCNYYNRRLSGWEPFIESWECMVMWKYRETRALPIRTMCIDATSKQILKVNITTTLIELCDVVRNNWIKDFYNSNGTNAGNLRQRSPFVPFALQNLTGEPLLFKTMVSQAGGITRTAMNQQDMMLNWISVQPKETHSIDFGPQTKLRHFDSHKLNLHQILVQIHGWLLIGPISVDKVGTYFRYATMDHKYTKRTRIVFEICLIGSAQKLIIVRSALNVVNKLNKRLLMKLESNEETVAPSMLNIEPNEKISIPLRLVDSLIFIKPFATAGRHGSVNRVESVDDTSLNEIPHTSSSFYTASTKSATTKYGAGAREEEIAYCTSGISWQECIKDSTQTLYACHGFSKSIFYFIVEAKRDRFPIRDLSNLPGHTITLLPPLKIRNMLSCDLLFKITENIEGRISSSEEIDIYTVKSSESFNLVITLDNYKISGQLKIPTGHSGVVELKLKLIDVLNRELYLCVSIQSYQGKGMEIYISAPVWIINRTGLPLVYRQEGASQLASGQFEEHEKARVVSPFLFSFSDDEASPSLEFRLGKSYGNNNPWCKSFNTHKDIFYRELRAEASKGSYAVGIHVRRGRGLYACTTFVKLTPRFQLCNKTSRKLQFAQKCDIYDNEVATANTISALPGCSFPFHWPNCEQEPLLCIRIADVEACQWSKGIAINEVQSVYSNIRNDYGEMSFLRLEVVLKGATYILIFTDAHTLPPPIRIDNYSNVLINFYQTNCKPLWRTVVKPLSSVAYVLDDPMGMMSLQIEVPDGYAIEFSLNHFDRSHSITYANFIYIAFQDTFNPYRVDATDGMDYDIEDDLVLAVRDKKVIIAKKCTGDRSQLWLMNSYGQLEHEGSSPPLEQSKSGSVNNTPRMVLDIDKSLNPVEFCSLVVRPPNKQRMTTQSWRFENGRLICHANLCIQVRGGPDGLYVGAEAVLGRFSPMRAGSIPIAQHIEFQKLRPGSGQLEIKSKMDGPIHTIQIVDVKDNQENIMLNPDPSWSHTSISTGKIFEDGKNGILEEYSVKFDLPKGLGVSIVSRHPCEELLFISLENITVDIFSTSFVKSIEIKVLELQIDNQLLDSTCPILLHTTKSSHDPGGIPKEAVLARAKVLPSPNKNAIIFEEFLFNLKPCALYLEERLILKVAAFLGYGEIDQRSGSVESNWDDHDLEDSDLARNSTRYYFEHLSLGFTQVRVSVFTTPKLSPELFATKKTLGLTLIKFEDALIEFERFVDKYHFETLDVYLKAIKTHYINQIKWGAAAILGSVDFLGNPLGFANDLSEGVTGLIVEGSVKSLVKNVAHGISNSTAKLTETLSDSLGRVVLDEQDNETRQKLLELQSNTSSSHIAAGFKGLGFGLLGGVTSIVRHTYVGTQEDGLTGFFSGLGKGLVGTVTKPLIGVLDLASETASAVRESSRGSRRTIPIRKRLPRCVTGAPGGLLPAFSYRQSKGQQYLYLINRRTFSEKLLAYEPNLCSEKEAKLRLLVSTENIRVFSRYEDGPTIMFQCHLREVLSCHPLTTNQSSSKSSSKLVPCYYIEISTNAPKITRPRIRCQSEEIAERAARCINYAKSVFDEREQSVSE